MSAQIKTVVRPDIDEICEDDDEQYFRLLVDDDVSPGGHEHNHVHLDDLSECNHFRGECKRARLYGHDFYFTHDQLMTLVDQITRVLGKR